MKQKNNAAIDAAVENLKAVIFSQITDSIVTGIAGLQAGGRRRKAVEATPAATRPLAYQAGKKIDRRVSGEATRLTSALLTRIKKKPGLPLRDYAEALGVARDELSYPAKRLRKSKAIQVKGTRSHAKYYAR